jgi:ACS family hexuronate transporter-like MFS transporter
MAKGKTGAVLDGLKGGHIRWSILLLLFLSTVLNYLDRQIFAVLAPILKMDVGLTNSDYALIINVFKIGAILGLFFAGPFMDKFGVRIGFAFAIILWSIGGGFTAIAAGLVTFAVFRFILGLGESGNWPAASKAVAEWFPAKERALAMGFFNGGVSIGAILAPFLVPLLVWITGSWRWAFVVGALFSIPWLYYWLKIYYPSSQHPRISKEELELIDKDRIKSSGKKKVYGVLKKKEFWGLFMARMITSPVWFFIAYWIFNYLHDEFGFNLKQMAFIAWIPFATADIGNIFGGYLSGKLIARGMRPIKSRIIMMGIGAGMMVASLFTAYSHNILLAISLISLLTFAWGIWVSNMLGLVTDSFPAEEVGTVMSWTGLGQYTGSLVFTWFIGYALDNFGMHYVPVFLTAAALPVIGYIFTFIMNRERRYE